MPKNYRFLINETEANQRLDQFLSRQPGLELVVLVEGDPLLLNPYGVIAVNPKKHPSVNFGLAQEFIGYLTG